MTLKTVEAVKSGFRRLPARNAAILIAAYFTLNVLNAAITDTLVAKYSSYLPNSSASATTLALPVPGFVAGFLIIPLVAASAALGIISLRVFTGDERNLIPRKYYRENIGRAVINIIAGGMVFGILVLLGIMIPLAPGIVLASTGMLSIGTILGLIGGLISLAIFGVLLVKLYFWTVFVSVEDENFFEGFKSSWNLTKGNSLRAGLLILEIVAISIILSFVFSLPILAGLTVVGAISSGLGGAISSALTAAIIAAAYNQLKEEEDEEEESGYIYRESENSEEETDEDKKDSESDQEEDSS